MADGMNGIRPEVAGEIESISSNNEHLNKSFYLRYLNPPLSEIEMVAIAEALSSNTHVEEVSLRRSLRDSPAVASSTFIKKILETHPSMREINISYNVFGCHLAAVIGLALKANTSLKVLDLSNNNIGPVGAEALAKGLHHNKSLQKLNLEHNQVGDRGVTALAGALGVNKTLEVLSLNCNEVTVVGAKSLASALEKGKLKQLNLTHNPLQDEGGKALAESLCKNKSLTSLDLCYTYIGDETCLALAGALCKNSTLRVLDINANDGITSVGATALEATLKHLNYAVEAISLHGSESTMNQRDRIHNFCVQNRRLSTLFQQVNQIIPAIPLGLWPRVLEAVECKPDLLYALLKAKPDVCRELQRRNRRRMHPDWPRY